MITNKKGIMLSMKTLGLLIFAVIFIFFVLNITSYATNPYTASSLFLSKDTSKMIDTLQAIPTDVHIEYPLSSDGKILSVDEKSTKVLQDRDEVKEQFAMQTSTFQPSSFYKIKPNREIDAALFSINKEGDTISFVDGANAKLALEQKIIDALASSKKKKNETPVYIYLITDKAKKTDMEYFRKSLEENLHDKNMTIVHLANESKLSIEIETTTAEKTTVLFSLQNTYETKRLAENILAVMPEDLSPVKIPQELSETTKTATVSIQLGTQAQTFLEKDKNKRFIARYIAIAIANYYD